MSIKKYHKQMSMFNNGISEVNNKKMIDLRPKKWGTGYLVLWECFQTKPCRADDLRDSSKFTKIFVA